MIGADAAHPRSLNRDYLRPPSKILSIVSEGKFYYSVRSELTELRQLAIGGSHPAIRSVAARHPSLSFGLRRWHGGHPPANFSPITEPSWGSVVFHRIARNPRGLSWDFAVEIHDSSNHLEPRRRLLPPIMSAPQVNHLQKRQSGSAPNVRKKVMD